MAYFPPVAANEGAPPVGRLTTAWETAWGNDAHLLDAHVVVELHLGDGTSRSLATVPLASGRAAAPGLVDEPSWVDSYDWRNPAATPRSLSVDVANSYLNSWDIFLRGYPTNGTCEVYLQWQAHDSAGRPVGVADYTQRRTVLRGNMVGETYLALPYGDFLAGSSSINLADPRDTENAYLPPYTVTEASWTTTISADGPHSSAIGQAYPLLYGYFERIGTLRVDASATPWWLVALGDVVVLKVYVNGFEVSDTDPDYAWETSRGVDAQGVLVTLVGFTVATTVWEDSDQVHVDATTSTYTKGNQTFTFDGYGDEPDVLDIIEDVIARFTPSGQSLINHELFGTARAKLGYLPARALVNASGAETTRVLDWLEQGFLGRSFPMISLVWQDGKLGPVVTDLRAAPVLDLTEGGTFGIERPEGIILSAAEDTYNSFKLRYDYGVVLSEDGSTEEYRKEASMDRSTSGLCAWAYATARDQERVYDIIDSEQITREDVALRVLDWLEEHWTAPTLSFEVTGSPILYFLLRRGDNVTLTLHTEGFDRIVCFVEALAYTRGRVTLTLRAKLTPRGLASR